MANRFEIKELNDILDAATKIDNLLRRDKKAPNSKSTELQFPSELDEPLVEEDEKNILAIEELRRRYDKLNVDYNHLRTRVLTVLGGGLALITFLFSKGGFTPHQQYGKIFYYAALGSLVYSFLVLFRCTFAGWWALPVEKKEISKLHKRHLTKRSFQEYIIEEYLEAINYCTSKINERSEFFNTAIQSLIIGAIILMVIKFTNGG